MVTILSMLEEGYESTFEHLTFRQLKGAFQCGLVCVPHDYATLDEALESTPGRKVFLLPPGRVDHSTEYRDWKMPDEDIVFVFGSPQETLVSYVGDSEALHITTATDSVMMAVCVAAIVLYGHG